MSFHAAQTPWGRARIARRARETSLRDVVYGLLNAAFISGSRDEGPEKHLPDMRPEAVDHLVAHCLTSTLDDHYRGAVGGRLDAAGVALLQSAVQSINEALVHRETIAATLIEAHPERELFASFLDACLDLDRALLQWRDRHIRFVEGDDRHPARHRRAEGCATSRAP